MGPLYRSRRFQDTIQVNSSLLSVPISLSQSSSPLLREEIADLLQKRAVERIQDPGTRGLNPRWFTLLTVLRRCCFVVYSTRRFVVCLTICHFVLVFFSPFSIAITSLGEERANLSAFRTFVRFVLVWICRVPLPLGVLEGLRFVIVTLLDFSLTFFYSRLFFVPKRMVIELSVLNQYIRKLLFRMETVKSIRQSILVND